MELIRTIKERRVTSQQNMIIQQAHDYICLDDFDDKMYISFKGTPLIPIEETWTPKDILKKLRETREGYINYETKSKEQAKSIAVF